MTGPAGDSRSGDRSGTADGGGERGPRVKICGITNAADRDAAVAAGADAVGVISDVPVDTPREVDEATAADLVAGVPPLVTSVLVTMPDSVEEAARLARSVAPDALQVHDGLAPAALGALGRRLDQDVVAGVAADADDVDAYADAADALLVDSADDDGGGGTGETHDWDRTRELVSGIDCPVILAGGLAPANVAEAVATVEPFAVDVATGVESDGGVKDRDAVRAFVAAATGEVRPA